MAFIKLPANQALKSKYTPGPEEYVYLKTYEPYIGYYYEINGRTFAGQIFSTNAPEIIKFDKKINNILLQNPDTEMYAKLSGMSVNSFELKGIPFNPSNKQIEQGYITRYFAKKIISNTFLDIKEVDQDTFKVISNDPLYTTLRINYTFSSTDKELNEFDKQMPGLKEYLQGDELNTSSDENQALIDELNNNFPSFFIK
jgi:hypothetical protein